MDIKKKIENFIISEICSEAGLDIDHIEDDYPLVQSHILDSLGILKLISYFDEELGIDISADEIKPENFSTIRSIVENLPVGQSPGIQEEKQAEPRVGKGASLSAEQGAERIETPSVGQNVSKPVSKMPTLSGLRQGSLDLGLTGKVVLITGASRGLGETMAKLFSLHGAKVVVNYYRGRQDAQRVVDEITGNGGEAFACQADVSSGEQVDAMVRRAVDAFGGVHVLVNNAIREFRAIDFMKTSWQDVQSDIDIVVQGAFNCCKAVIPLMLAGGGGKIVNMGTLATDNPPPNQFKYVVAKSALVGLTRSLAVAYASKNIQVNMVSPSFVETDLVSHIPKGYRDKIGSDTPMKRNAAPEDVAGAALFLASSYASFTTGQKIMVTGGDVPFL